MTDENFCKMQMIVSIKTWFYVSTGEENGEKSQQDGVQAGESPTGKADVEPEDERSGPEAFIAA